MYLIELLLKRMIQVGGIKVNGVIITDKDYILENEMCDIQVGKKES